MKAIALVGMLLLLIATVSAGSISDLDTEDCVDTHNVCVHQTCTHWHPHGCHGGGCTSCQNWECDRWEEQCDDHIDTTISDDDVNIDADTLGGQTGEDIIGEANDHSDAGDQDVKDYADTGDNNLSAYINANEGAWVKDQVGGGGGMGSDGLGHYLTGNYQLFDTWNSYLEFEYGIFATIQQLDRTNDRIDLLEAKLELGKDATAEQLMFKAGLIKSARLGQPVKVDGYICDARTDSCIKVTPVESPPTEEETQIQQDETNRNQLYLVHYRELCARGLRLWCMIADQRAADWGLV